MHHHGGSAVAILLSAEIALTAFVLTVGALWWAVPRLVQRRGRARRRPGSSPALRSRRDRAG